MSPVALTLNLALGALLIGAMILGLRLDRKLRVLRDSHSGFAKAVSELDQAAERTQAGLAALKATAEDSRTALAERIDAACILADRLTKLIAEAQAGADTLAKQTPPARPVPLREAPTVEPPRPATAPVRSLRSRAAIDDELFEVPPPTLSALAGGRR